jgi:hypothetical protein
VFKKVQDEHIEFMNELMQGRKTKDLTVSRKLKRIKEKFPQLEISRSTV